MMLSAVVALLRAVRRRMRWSASAIQRTLFSMRGRSTKGAMCVLLVTSLLVLAMLMLRTPHLSPSLATTPSILTTTPSPPASPHRAIVVPPKPSGGEVPEMPLPGALRSAHLAAQGLQPQSPQRPHPPPSLGLQTLYLGVKGKPPAQQQEGKQLALRVSPSVQAGGEIDVVRQTEELWDLLLAPTPEPVVESLEQLALSRCVPRYHVFFGKVHKTGSSTVANILQRFGSTRRLNFALPRKRLNAAAFNYITMPGQTPSLAALIPPPLDQHYDMLWSHAVYDSRFFHSIMPRDTVYVTILRHPLQQFQSAFEYYGHLPGSYLYTILQSNVSNPLSLYLHNTSRYEPPNLLASYVRNKQSQDLGMRADHLFNATLRWEYIGQLDRDFHLVMMTEMFDESLVMLRRLLCWGVKDVLYITVNKNIFKKRRVFTDGDLTRHQLLSAADYDLYDFFLKRFRTQLAQQGPDFQQEVAYFKQLLPHVLAYCRTSKGKTPLRVPASPWSVTFTLTHYDCQQMLKPELHFLNDLVKDAVHRYHSSVLHRRAAL